MSHLRVGCDILSNNICKRSDTGMGAHSVSYPYHSTNNALSYSVRTNCTHIQWYSLLGNVAQRIPELAKENKVRNVAFQRREFTRDSTLGVVRSFAHERGGLREKASKNPTKAMIWTFTLKRQGIPLFWRRERGSRLGHSRQSQRPREDKVALNTVSHKGCTRRNL